MKRLPVSVIVPTIGRRDLLKACVASIVECRPTAAEVLIVDQSHGAQVQAVVDALQNPSVRRIECDGSGIARAMNRGLAIARHDTIFVTHDDCTVADDWIAVGARLIEASPDAIVTGRVMAPAGARYVPSTKSDPRSHDFTGEITTGVLYPANMIAHRKALTSIGGFDERRGFRVAAEDNDLCYRWLTAGRRLFYEPDLVVCHHDWRTPEQLVQTHAAYARAQGVFYAKYLYRRDRRVLPMLAWDLRYGLRATLRGTMRNAPRWEDEYRETLRWLPVGLVAGFVEAWRLRKRGSHSERTSPV